MKKIVLILCVVLLAGCKNTTEETAETVAVDTDLESLFEMMQGSFNSEAQALQDSSYFNISLHMYPIWEQHGNYLYVEQALNSMQDKPYRQRVYEVSRLNDSVISSAVYTLEADSLWIGKWKDPKAFDSISPTELTIREGCAVLLQKISENAFAGATSPTDCKSSLRGATHATSKVEISPGKIASWDQGWNSEGEQVWGAEKGGYIFEKVN